jgi:hypothetical protein
LFCFSQEQITTYQHNEHLFLNITLNGKVKFLKQVSYSPDILCDTIQYRRIRLGEINLGCINDTLLYYFDNKLLLKKVKKIENKTFSSVNKERNEYIYEFSNGNLFSETTLKNGKFSFQSIYKYDQNNNLKSKSTSRPILLTDSLEYDLNNNLIRKTTYHYETGFKGGLKKPTIHTVEDFQYENNRLIESYSISKSQQRNTYSHFLYDEQGRKVEIKIYGIDNDTILESHYVYKYFENGQQVIEEEIVGNNWQIDYESYKILITKYDENRNIFEQKYYLSDNQPLKVIRYDYFFDSINNWIRREKLEGKNENDLSKTNIEERFIEYYSD